MNEPTKAALRAAELIHARGLLYPVELANVIDAETGLPQLLAAVQRAYAVENSTTQAHERELRVGYFDMLRAAITAEETP